MQHYAACINARLCGDPALAHVLPLQPCTAQVAAACRDGILLWCVLHVAGLHPCDSISHCSAAMGDKGVLALVSFQAFSCSQPDTQMDSGWATPAMRSKLLNACMPDAVDERAVNLPGPGAAGPACAPAAAPVLARREAAQNCALAINAAKAVGCSMADVDAQDILDGKVRSSSSACLQPCPSSPPCVCVSEQGPEQ